MIRFAVDESFDGRIIDGVRLKYPQVDLITAQEAGMSGAPDPEVFDWATELGRVVLSRDKSSMKELAEEYCRLGLPFVGVLFASDRYSIGMLMDQIEAWSRRELDEAFAYPIQFIQPY